MQLMEILCFTLLMVTMTTTCIQAEANPNELAEKKLEKRISRRTTTLVVENPPPGRVFQQPKVVFKRIMHKSYTPPRTTYGPRRTKYGPPRSIRKPGLKYRGKGAKRSPYSHKKRTSKPRYGPPKQHTSSAYGPPKKTPNRVYNSIGFGEPPSDYSFKKYRPPKPTEFSRPHKPNSYKEHVPKPQDIDFSSPATFGDTFPDKPFDDNFEAMHQFNSFSHSQGYGEPPIEAFAPVEHGKEPFDSFKDPIQETYKIPVKATDPPVDSYGAPIKPNLHDLTFATAQSYFEPTSPLDEDTNFGSSRPWNDFKDFKDASDNSYAFTKKRPAFAKLEESDDVFVTPVPEKVNEELALNSYSDIFNYRQSQKENKKKKRTNYYQNVKILNHPWKGPKLKESNDEILVGGQYAEPPARYVPKVKAVQPSAPMLSEDEDTVFSPTVHFPSSSYVNYKNSNLAFSPQNLNDVFSIVDK